MKNPACLSIGSIIRSNKVKVTINVLLTTFEILLIALVPLFIGFAIDGLLVNRSQELVLLMVTLMSLIVMSVLRRFYDTRAYGSIRVQVQSRVVATNSALSLSVLNARLDMGRELVDFLEQSVPELLNACVQFFVSLIVLFFLHPVLACAASASAVIMIVIYSLFHGFFYTANRRHNQQTERQVSVLETQSVLKLTKHLNYLKRLEIKISDREAILYGSVFFALLAMIVFNLWYSTQYISMSAGKIFSIVSYSWEFVEAAIVLPTTLQSWSRLSEITSRINGSKLAAS